MLKKKNKLMFMNLEKVMENGKRCFMERAEDLIVRRNCLNRYQNKFERNDVLIRMAGFVYS